MTRLRYGNTNTFYLPGSGGGLLVDTDWAGTLGRFFRALGEAGLTLKEIRYVMATHYHPDHMGLVGELQRLGVTLLLAEEQAGAVHASDGIFGRDPGLRYVPVDETAAVRFSCGESRAVLSGIGIRGELLSTPSHSRDSVSLLLDDGVCIVGDLEPLSYLEGYGENAALRRDWERLLARRPREILYAHASG